MRLKSSLGLLHLNMFNIHLLIVDSQRQDRYKPHILVISQDKGGLADRLKNKMLKNIPFKKMPVIIFAVDMMSLY